MLQQCIQTFWKRWRGEYLQILQPRGRWVRDQPSLTVNDLFVIKEVNTPPLEWPLGRIVKVMPCNDGVVRIAQMYTAHGIYTRPVVKLVRLPTPT